MTYDKIAYQFECHLCHIPSDNNRTAFLLLVVQDDIRRSQPSLAEKPNGWLILKMNFFSAAALNHRDSHLNASLKKKASSLLVFHLFIAPPII